MKKINNVLLYVVLAFMLFFSATVAIAQKLPNVQKTSLRAPVNIKIDGTAAEWNDQFAAHNSATDVSYTLSNDDENIYLILQAKYHDIVDKILRGGVTLTINHTIKKKDVKPVVVTYPILQYTAISNVSNAFARATYKQDDENKLAVEELNKILHDNEKVINISGIESIPDSSLSIYNTERIKTDSQFDKQLNYTYELAIPLKYLALPNNGANAFSYQIKINPPLPIHLPLPNSSGVIAPPPPPVLTSTLSATDFWGEYTLVKK